MNISEMKSSLNNIEFAFHYLDDLYKQNKLKGMLADIALKRQREQRINQSEINFVRASLIAHHIEDLKDIKQPRPKKESITINVTVNNYATINNTPKTITDLIKKKYTIINPKWVENNYMRRWNGDTPKHIEIYEITPDGIALPAPCLDDIDRMIDSHGLEMNLIDKRKSIPVEIEFAGDLHDLQAEAIKPILEHNYGTLVAATGSGKTVMGLYILAARKQKTIIIVHTKDLAHQWIAQIKKFLSLKDEDVGLIGSGSNTIGKKITVALVQSVYSRLDHLGDQFGMIVVDESHRTPSRVFSTAVNAFNTCYRLGLTATPKRRDKLHQLIFWTVGPIRHEVSKKKLISEGHILQPEFIMRQTGYTTKIKNPAENYSEVISELCDSYARNCIIVDDIAKQTGSTLIISDRKWHLEEMKFQLYNRHKIVSEVLTGSTKDKERTEIIKRINEGQIQFLFATGQLIGEGFDCKVLSTMFITTPIKFSGRVLQYIGRIMRPAEGKEQPVVYDYIDDIPMLIKSAKARMKVYEYA